MTEQKNVQNTTKDTDNPEERAALRERAKIMGLTFSPNISNAELKKRIDAHLNSDSNNGEGNEDEPYEGEEDEGPVVMDDVSPEVKAQRIVEGSLVQRMRPNPTGNRLTKRQREQLEREKQWREQLVLVRVKVTCHNPSKAQLRGEVFTVSNKYIGTIRKFVPFGVEEGYHVPQIILTMMQERKYQSVTTKKMDRGGLSIVPEVRIVPEFAIEILPPLTEVELERLRRSQLAASNQ